MSKLTLRYFARFKGDTGYLRAVVRYDGHRKYLTTPIVITRTQLPRLKSFGRIVHADDLDAKLDGQLLRFSDYILQTAKPLIDSGEFAALSGKELGRMVMATKEKEESRHRHRSLEMAEREFGRRAEDALYRGRVLQGIDIALFNDLIKQLKEQLTPEEYREIWEKGGIK